MDTNIKGIDLEVMGNLVEKFMEAIEDKPEMEIHVAITYVLTVVIYRCNEEQHIEKKAEIFSRGLLNSIRAFKLKPTELTIN